MMIRIPLIFLVLLAGLTACAKPPKERISPLPKAWEMPVDQYKQERRNETR